MTKLATFALGCFWKPDRIFSNLDGVVEVKVGYSGGHVDNPTYEMVCGGETGHAETVQVEYDPKKVSYEILLDAFWNSHDPTQVNRQGPDVGEQYRSVIFYYDDEQKRVAEESKKRLTESGKYDKPIATGIVRASKFYKAEDYHQKYLEKKGI
jgi:peptide-methionine (S)-S-oxide reductase